MDKKTKILQIIFLPIILPLGLIFIILSIILTFISIILNLFKVKHDFNVGNK